MIRQFKLFFIGLIVLLSLIAEGPLASATPTWTTPQEISSPATDSNAPQVASDSAGNFITLFQNKVGSDYQIQSTRSGDFGATWSTPISISLGTNASNPRIISIGPRAFVATWNQYDGTSSRIAFSKTVDSGVTWIAPIYISVAGQSTRIADIAFDGQNSLGVVWTRQLSGFTYTVSATGSSDLGSTWATPQDLTSSSPGSMSPQIASTGAGSFVSLWHSLSSPVIVQSSSTTNSGTSWTSPITASDSSRSSTYPQVVSISGNKIVATWLQDFSFVTVQSSSISLDNGASWSTPQTISTQSSNSAEGQLTKLANGTLVSVWYQDIGSGYQILSSRSTDEGSTWSSPTLVSTQTGCFNPQVANDAASNISVVWWCGQNSSSVVATASSSDSASSWNPTTSITQSPLFGNFASIAVSPAGDTTVSWQMNYTGSLYKVFSSSYIVSSLPPQPQPDTLPPTGVNFSLTLLPLILITSGVLMVMLRNRKMQPVALRNKS